MNLYKSTNISKLSILLNQILDNNFALSVVIDGIKTKVFV
jgi:hypothetical protein